MSRILMMLMMPFEYSDSFTDANMNLEQIELEQESHACLLIKTHPCMTNHSLTHFLGYKKWKKKLDQSRREYKFQVRSNLNEEKKKERERRRLQRKREDMDKIRNDEIKEKKKHFN